MRTVTWAIGVCAATVAATSALGADISVKVVAPAPVAVPPPRWEFTFNTEARYFAWESSRGYPTSPSAFAQPPAQPGRGSQLYVPFAFQLTGRPTDNFKVELLARAGYMSARQSTGGMSGEMSTVLDTILSGTVTYLGWAGIQPFVSLNLNVPTGKSLLQGSAGFARGDSDLVDIPALGEGFNIGPTVGVNLPVSSNFILTGSVGYTNRDRFNREANFSLMTGGIGIVSLDPGDVWTVAAGFAYQIGALTLQGSGSYAFESTTTYDGRPAYKSGDRYSVTGVLAYAWNQDLSSKITTSFSHFENNQVRQPFVAPLDIPLVLEAFNTNSNVTKVNFDTTYRIGALAFGPTAGFVYRDRNGWDPTTFQFVPAKTSWSAGGAAQYAVTQQVTLTARGEHRWVNENENPDKIIPPLALPIAGTGVPVIISSGWMVSVGGLVRF